MDGMPDNGLVRKLDGYGTDLGIMEVIGYTSGPVFLPSGDVAHSAWNMSLCEPVSDAEAAEYWREKARRLEREAETIAKPLPPLPPGFSHSPWTWTCPKCGAPPNHAHQLGCPMSREAP